MSHQVKALETELGLQLLRAIAMAWSSPMLVAFITPWCMTSLIGSNLAPIAYLQRQRSGTITVSTSPDFADSITAVPPAC